MPCRSLILPDRLTSTLTMEEAVCFSETFIPTYPNTRYHNPEYHSMNLNRRENFKLYSADFKFCISEPNLRVLFYFSIFARLKLCKWQHLHTTIHSKSHAPPITGKMNVLRNLRNDAIYDYRIFLVV